MFHQVRDMMEFIKQCHQQKKDIPEQQRIAQSASNLCQYECTCLRDAPDHAKDVFMEAPLLFDENLEEIDFLAFFDSLEPFDLAMEVACFGETMEILEDPLGELMKFVKFQKLRLLVTSF